jgi:acetyl-CoA carboxylase alpha subunit
VIDQIRTTLETMRSTAQDQLDHDLIDEVIPEDDSPFVSVERVHGSILRAYVELAALSKKRLRSRCPERIRGLRAFEIIQE